MAELKPTYGNFKLKGVVQGLKRKYAFNDDSTKSGIPKHRLQFSVKTREDNIVDVEVQGMKFDKLRITPRDRNDKQTKDIPWNNEVPEDWEVFMGATHGLKQGEDGKNILTNESQFSAAKSIYEQLKDGDFVFIGGRNEFSKYTNRNDEEIINDTLSFNRIYHSTKQDDDDEVSSFNQFVILNDIDLNKKEKKAYVSTFIIANRFGQIQVVPYTFWIDGNKYNGLINNLRKLPFGTQVKVEGTVHSHPIYKEVESVDDSWGSHSTGFEPRQAIDNVEKSLEITFADPTTIEEKKYTQEDLFPPEDNKLDDSDNPFENTDNSSDDWGNSSGSNDSSDDPFGDDSF